MPLRLVPLPILVHLLLLFAIKHGTQFAFSSNPLCVLLLGASKESIDRSMVTGITGITGLLEATICHG